MPVFNSPATIGLMVSNPNPYPDGQVVDPAPATIAATGTTQATAAPIVNDVTTITNNTAANGVILPVPSAGQRFFIIPALATNAPLVYPPVGGSINFGTANAGVAITARKMAEFVALDSVGNYALIQSA
jgi:hypothetical protein